MKKRIIAYLNYVDKMIEQEEKDGNIDLDAVMKNHLTQIAFFAHERLIHLIVTVLFALGTFVSISSFLFYFGTNKFFDVFPNI